MPSAVSIQVGVVIAREDIDSEWEDHIWRPVGVLPGARAMDDWTELRRGEGWVHYYARTIALELHRKETESYKYNLEGREPVLFVILNDDDEGEFPYDVHLVTASPYEAADYLDSGEQIVEPVEMPEPVFAFVSQFVDEHHAEEKFKKRKRSEVNVEEHKFGQEPIFELRKRMGQGNGHE